MTKQELLDFVGAHFPKDKASDKLKRLIFATYTGKYIIFKNMKFPVSVKCLKILYSALKDMWIEDDELKEWRKQDD